VMWQPNASSRATFTFFSSTPSIANIVGLKDQIKEEGVVLDLTSQ
jgi:hypothetical protein